MHSIAGVSSHAPPSETPPVIPDHELLRRIGKGAYGEVWLGRNVMGTWRAVKIVRREQFESARPYEREFAGIKKFEPVSRTNEAQMDVLHVGRNDAAGYFYYVLELADDVNTGQVIDPVLYVPKTLRGELERAVFTSSRCLDVGITLCTALEHLHANGLVHRDVKPSNIIFVNGRPKLADIGLVAGFGESQSFVGTEGFVPPEGPGTPSADVFSLGKVLYELHTGMDREHFPELPEGSATDADPELARDLNLIILKACSPAMRVRHATARELREELQLLQGGRSIRRLRVAERRAVFFRRVGLVAAAVAVVASVGFFSARRANARADAQTQRAEWELLGARLAGARGWRLSGEAGRRAQALAALREAAEVRPSRELRDEAIATLALTDIEPTGIFLPHPAEALAKAQLHPSRCAFSDDLARVAWCNLDATVSVVRVADRVAEHRFPSPGGNASALGSVWSPDGKYLAVSYRGEIRVWDLAGEKVICRSETTAEPTEAGGPVSFSADGTRVALHSDEGVCVHALPGGVLTKNAPLPDGVQDFHLHPTEPWLAVREGKNLKVFDYRTRAPIQSYEQTSNVLGMQWSPDGRQLGAMLRNGRIFIADVRAKPSTILPGHPERAIQLVFSPSGSWLAVGSRDGSTRLWPTSFAGPPAATVRDGLVQKFSLDGQRLAYTSAEGVGIWRLAEPGPLYTALSGWLGADLTEHIDFSPDGKWLVSIAAGNAGFAVWDLATRRVAATGIGSGTDRYWLRFTPDGKRLLTLGLDGLRLWPVVMTDGHFGLGAAVSIPIEDGAAINGLAALSADGHRLLVRVQPQRVLLLDLEKGNAVTPIGTDFEARTLAWSPDGRRIVAGTRKGSGAQVLDAAERKVIRVIGDGDTNAEYSPDGQWLAVFTPSHCEFYHAQTMRLAKVFRRVQLERNPGVMAFSADGRFFAYLKRHGQAELIDAATLDSLATIDLPDGGTAEDLAFSRDGQWLALHDKIRCHLYHLPTLRRELRELRLDW